MFPINLPFWGQHPIFIFANILFSDPVASMVTANQAKSLEESAECWRPFLIAECGQPKAELRENRLLNMPAPPKPETLIFADQSDRAELMIADFFGQIEKLGTGRSPQIEGSRTSCLGILSS